MDDKIHHALQASAYCEAIKDGLRGLSRILDVGNDAFGEMNRLESYKAMFQKIDEWQQQYEQFLQEQSDAPTVEQTM